MTGAGARAVSVRLRDGVGTIVGAVERFFHPNYAGLVVATVFFAWSLTPSLLPRDWLFEGLVSGINAAIGYGVGCVLEWVYRRWIRPNVHLPAAVTHVLEKQPNWLPGAVKVAIVVACVLVAVQMLVQSARWQREITALMGMDPITTSGFLRTGALSALVGAIAIGAFRSVRWLVRWVATELTKWMPIPRRAALPVGFVLVAFAAILLFNGVLFKAFFSVANSAFSVRNGHTSPNAVQPQGRSGPAARLHWRRGRRSARRGAGSFPMDRTPPPSARSPASPPASRSGCTPAWSRPTGRRRRRNSRWPSWSAPARSTAR